jgi:hypothetical protein
LWVVERSIQMSSVVIRFRFVHDNMTKLSVERMCELIEVPRSSFYTWLTRSPPAREVSDAVLIDSSVAQQRFRVRNHSDSEASPGGIEAGARASFATTKSSRSLLPPARTSHAVIRPPLDSRKSLGETAEDGWQLGNGRHHTGQGRGRTMTATPTAEVWECRTLI